MDSICLHDPLGQLLECACYKFEPPLGSTHAEVLLKRHTEFVWHEAHITSSTSTWQSTIELLVVRNQQSLSADRSAKDPYTSKPPVWD